MLKLLLALSLLATPVVAQVPGVPITIPGFGATTSPYGFPIKRVNNLDTAPITFEGQRLFVIAAPAAAPDTAIPAIVQRVETITDNLQRIVPPARGLGQAPIARFDAKTFKVNVGSENGYPTLYATDGHKRDVAPIMTLTEADASLNGLPRGDLAVHWQGVLQSSLGHALLATEPEHLAEQQRRLPFVVGGGILATLLLVFLRRRLRRRDNEVQAAADGVDAPGTKDGSGTKQLRTEGTVLSGTLWLLNWFVVGLWVLIILWVLSIVPATRVLATELSNRVVRIVILWLGLALFDSVLNVAIVRIAEGWESRPFATADERTRLVLRRPTFVRAAENLKSIVLWAIAIIATLSVLSVSATSVLTIGAIIAFSLSFAAQNLIKDFLNGFLILAEDQFAIGDYVIINGFAGSVEDLTLRIAQIRTDDGRLVTIPNGTIAAVENQTRLWSRIDFRVAVAASSDIERAIAVLKTTLDEIAADPVWGKQIVEPPQVLGVDAISHAGIVLRAWVKTAPTQKAAVTREINRRVDEAFRKDSIALGMPQSVVLQMSEPSPAPEAPTPGPPSR